MTDPTPPSPPARDRKLGIAALAIAVAALAVAALPLATGLGFDARVRAYLLKHPEVLQEVSLALQAQEDQGHADRILEQAEAFPALLAVSADDPAFGPADAKVTVIEFFDFRCPGCKATAPDVLRLMEQHQDVRFVFRDWPILDRGEDGASHLAARAALAAHREGKYLPVFRQLMALPASELSEESVDQVLTQNGVDPAAARAVMRSPETARHLAEVQTAGSALQLVGTPTFFVNGKPQASIQPDELDRAIRAAKSAA